MSFVSLNVSSVVQLVGVFILNIIQVFFCVIKTSINHRLLVNKWKTIPSAINSADH